MPLKPRAPVHVSMWIKNTHSQQTTHNNYFPLYIVLLETKLLLIDQLCDFVSGTMIGMIISMLIPGLLCTLEIAGGWPLIFYVFGKLYHSLA